MESPKFHGYPKLPQELKDMIWKLRAEKQKSGVRHYIGVAIGKKSFHRSIQDPGAGGGLIIKTVNRTVYEPFYMRLNTNGKPRSTYPIYTGRLFQSTVVIRGKLMTKFPLRGTQKMRMYINGRLYSYGRVKSPFIRGDFEYEVFVFGANQARPTRQSMLFQSIAWPLTSPNPAILPNGHWLFNVHKVALQPYPRFWENYRGLHPFDKDCLSRIQNLRTLYVIIPSEEPECQVRKLPDVMKDKLNDDGFLPSFHFMLLHQNHEEKCRKEHKDGPCTMTKWHIEKYDTLLSDLAAVFQNRPEPPKIQVVMDPYDAIGINPLLPALSGYNLF